MQKYFFTSKSQELLFQKIFDTFPEDTLITLSQILNKILNLKLKCFVKVVSEVTRL